MYECSPLLLVRVLLVVLVVPVVLVVLVVMVLPLQLRLRLRLHWRSLLLRCSALQRVAACCSALQRVAARCSVLQRVAAPCSIPDAVVRAPGTKRRLDARSRVGHGFPHDRAAVENACVEEFAEV